MFVREFTGRELLSFAGFVPRFNLLAQPRFFGQQVFEPRLETLNLFELPLLPKQLFAYVLPQHATFFIPPLTDFR